MQKSIRMFTVAFAGVAVLLLAGCESTPPPKPVHHALPPPAAVAVSTHQSLSADALFGFGKADLQNPDNAELSALVQKLRSARQINAVQLIGYSDRLGNAAYNQKLSEKRAEAVRDFLVAHGIASSAIQTEGRGIADPVAECPHLKSRKLMACLAPNRRVEVNISAVE